jgi:hypothetical protein
MHTPEEMSPSQRELEGALRSLRPDAARVDDVELAFRLGAAAGARRVRAWQRTSALNGIAVVALALALIGTRAAPGRHSGGGPVREIASRAPDGAPTESVPVRSFSMPGSLKGHFLTSSYLRLRERSLRLGAESLGEPPPTGAIGDPLVGTGARSGETPEQSELDFFVKALAAGRRS